MKLSLKERKLVTEYAKRLIENKSNLTEFTDEDLKKIGTYFKKIKPIVDEIMKIIEQYDTEKWGSETRESSYDIANIYTIMRGFGVDE